MAPTQPHAVDTQVEVLRAALSWPRSWSRLARFPAKPLLPSLPLRSARPTSSRSWRSRRARAWRETPPILWWTSIRQSDENKVQSIRETREFVERKLHEAQEQLSRADERLRTFKEQNHLPNLTSNLASAIAVSNSVGEELRRSETSSPAFAARPCSCGRALPASHSRSSPAIRSFPTPHR